MKKLVKERLNENNITEESTLSIVCKGLNDFFEKSGNVTEIGGDSQKDYLKYLEDEVKEREYFGNENFQYNYEFEYEGETYKMEIYLEADFEYKVREMATKGEPYGSEVPSPETGDIEIDNLTVTDIGVFDIDDKEIWYATTDETEYESLLLHCEESEETISRIKEELTDHMEDLVN